MPDLAPRVAGTRVTETWKFEIVDPAAVPRHFLAPDEKAIGAYVRTQKGNAKIEGVRTWAETNVS